MNHCLLEVKVKQTPTIRYTQDNQTPVAEMEVLFDGLRAEDPPAIIKVVGWGNLAQELNNRIQINQKLILEGRLRMNTISRQDGSKEKKAELTLSRLHFKYAESEINNNKSNKDIGVLKNSQSNQYSSLNSSNSNDIKNRLSKENDLNWDTSPLVPDTDDIPF